MDIKKVTQFKLLKENLPNHIDDNRYWFDTVNKTNVRKHKANLQIVLNFILDELEWDYGPNMQDVFDRIEFGSLCHLWMYDDNVLGWHWTNDECVTHDWKTFAQKIKSNEIYIGGAFVSRNNKPSASSAIYFYRQGFEYSFELSNTNTMYLYSDYWNRASAQLCYKCGFTKYNFLNENN